MGFRALPPASTEPPPRILEELVCLQGQDRSPGNPPVGCVSDGQGGVCLSVCREGCKQTPVVKHSSRLLSNSFKTNIEMIHPFDCHAISAFAASFFIKPDVCQINLAHLIFSLHLNLCFSECAIPFFGLFHILAVRRDV